MGRNFLRRRALWAAVEVCVLLAATVPVRGLDPKRALTQYRQTVWTTQQGLPHNTINSIGEDADGYLVLETFAGTVRFDGERFEPIQPLPHAKPPKDFYDHFPDPKAANFAVLSDHSGRLWIGTRSGLFRRTASGQWAELHTEEGRSFDGVPFIGEDRHGRVWAGTQDRVYCFEGEQMRHYGAKEGLRPGVVHGVVEDKDGNIWVASQGSGLLRLRNGRFEKLGTEEGFPSDALRWVHEDRQGNLWVATAGAGLVRLSDDLFLNVTTREGLVDDVIWSVIEDHKQNLWVGTNRGLTLLAADGSKKSFGAKDGLTNLSIQTLAELHDGRLWVGTHAGLFEMRGSRLAPVFGQDALPSGDMHAMLEDASGAVWVATNAGLSRWDKGKWTHYTAADGLGVAVRGMCLARDGGIWLATFGKGVLHFDGHTFVSAAKEIAGEVVRDVMEDERGVLWISTPGLSRLENGKLTRFQVPAATDDTVHTVRMDDVGNLWLSTNHGILRVPRADLDDHAAGGDAAPPIRWTIYRESEGLRTSEANGPFKPPAFRAHDGRIWFATMAGLTSIDPRQWNPPSPSIPAHIEAAVTEDGRSWTSGAAFAAQQRRLEFRYTGLLLGSPERVRFRYRLDPVDESWWEAGTRRQATYGNLGPGSYRFRVAAAGPDGVFREDPSAFDFTIAPFFYERTSFRATMAMLILAGIFSVPVVRGRRLRRRQAELTRMVDEKTVEIRHQKDEIEQQAHELQKQNEILGENVRLKDEVERISRHDLRTPLTSIISLAQIVREGGGLPAEHDASLQLIEQAGYRVLNMANLTLDLFKMEQGTYRLTPAAVDIRAVAERVVVDLRAILRTREVTCEISAEAEADHPIFIVGDELLCYSMLTNLVKNAVEASPRGGKVTVHIAGGDRVAIRIHNQQAIPAEVRSRFFQKYSTAGKKGGTGLGAYSASLMAATQGGKITAESSEEKGTTIVIELAPAAAADRPQTDAGTTSSTFLLGTAEWPARKILIVDDDGNNRAILRHFLSHPKWSLGEAENGPLALEMVKNNSYDFVLLDIEMPVMDGFDVVAQIRRAEPNGRPQPKVIALSSHDDPVVGERALKAGFDQYLTKPVGRRVLLEAIIGAAAVKTVTLDADVRHLIPGFLVKKKEEVQVAAGFVASRDHESARREFHRLRGSFNMYGFSAAAALCAEMEQLARSNQIERIGERLTSLSEYLNQVEVHYTDETKPEAKTQ